MLRRSFCLLQLLEKNPKKPHNIQSLQLLISWKSGEASRSGNHRHMTTWIISHSSHPGCFWTICCSSEIFPECCMALRCTPKINQAMCDTKAFTFFPSRGMHSINLYPFFLSALALFTQIVQNAFPSRDASFTSNAHLLKAILYLLERAYRKLSRKERQHI